MKKALIALVCIMMLSMPVFAAEKQYERPKIRTINDAPVLQGKMDGSVPNGEKAVIPTESKQNKLAFTAKKGSIITKKGEKALAQETKKAVKLGEKTEKKDGIAAKKMVKSSSNAPKTDNLRVIMPEGMEDKAGVTGASIAPIEPMPKKKFGSIITGAAIAVPGKDAMVGSINRAKYNAQAPTFAGTITGKQEIFQQYVGKKVRTIDLVNK